MFEGAYTAIVTPFTRDGQVDYARFRDLIEFQIAGGIDGLVPVGTTGESPTLDFKEHEKVVEVAIETARRRVKIIAGTGANSTAEALELTRHALHAGADGTLQDTPYYNKPNSLGLVRHFSAVADLGLPVVLYNVPGRSGKEIPIDVVVELAVIAVDRKTIAPLALPAMLFPVVAMVAAVMAPVVVIAPVVEMAPAPDRGPVSSGLVSSGSEYATPTGLVLAMLGPFQ